MTIKNTLFSGISVILSSFLLAAPAAAQKAEGLQGQVKDAATSMAKPSAPLVFSVKGLTKDNTDQVKRSLMALTETTYVCPGCKHVEARAGKCVACDVDTKATTGPVLSEATPSFKDESIRLTLKPAQSLRYSVLEGALTKGSIEIDDSGFPLVGASRLVLRGGSPEDVAAIEKTLEAGKLFDSAKADYDLASKEIRVVVHAGSTPPMYGAVAAAIEALDTKATLADVIWGPLPIPAKI